MRLHSSFFAASTVISATVFLACAEEDNGLGSCVTTHQSLPEQLYEDATLEECEEYCAEVSGYVCCYFDPDLGPWVPVGGDC